MVKITTHLHNGYVMQTKPSWYTKEDTQNYIREHILIVCEREGITEIPDGYVVHHIDLTRDNNDPNNLALMTRSDHIKLHWKLRGKMTFQDRLCTLCGELYTPTGAAQQRCIPCGKEYTRLYRQRWKKHSKAQKKLLKTTNYTGDTHGSKN